MGKNKIKLFPLVLLFLLTATNLLFTGIPLLDTLHYEVSAINSVIISLFAGFLTLYFKKKNEKAGKQYFVYIFLFIIIPFLISLTSTVLCRVCPFTDGIYFYFVLSAPSVLIGSTIALFAKYISYKFRYLLFIIIWMFILFGFLPELYFNPQIYFYNPILGYFPGTMYDENIEIGKNLILYRTGNIFFSLLVFYFISLSKTRKVVVIPAVMIFYFITGMLKPEMNFASSEEKIIGKLKGFTETEHFKIIYPKELSDTEKEVLKLNHEFYYSEIKNLLQVEPEGKITSFIFKTGAQKKELFGSKNADVSKLWINQIYLNYDFYDNSLKHEIAHVFSAKFANGIFKMPAKYNPAMLEGFAMAVENNYDDYDIDYLTYLAFENNYKTSLENLFTDFSFFTQTSSVSYIYAGSFIKYLAKKFGWNKVKQLYSELDFKKIYGKNLKYLQSDFIKYLKSKNYFVNKHKANLYFGRLPLVKKKCPHETAKQLKIAREHYKNKNYKAALKTYKEIYRYSKSYPVLLGIVKTEMKINKFEKAKLLLEKNITGYKNTAYYYSMENILANVYVNLNEFVKADALYDKLIKQNARNVYANIAKVKKVLLNIDVGKLKNFLRNEKERKEILKQILISNPDDATIQLVTLLKLNDEEYASIMKSINKFTNKNKYSSDTYLQLSKFAYRFLDFEKAMFYSELSMRNVKPERKTIVKEQLDKISWSLKNKQK